MDNVLISCRNASTLSLNIRLLFTSRINGTCLVANSAPDDRSMARNTLPNPPRPICSPLVHCLMMDNPLCGEPLDVMADGGCNGGILSLAAVVCACNLSEFMDVDMRRRKMIKANNPMHRMPHNEARIMDNVSVWRLRVVFINGNEYKMTYPFEINGLCDSDDEIADFRELQLIHYVFFA